MKRRLGFLALFCFVFLMSNAQKHDQNWMLGDSCGLRFDEEGVSQNSRPLISSYEDIFENNYINVSFSDVNGDLLGYLSPGVRQGSYYYYRILNKNGEIVHGSDSIITTVYQLGSTALIYQNKTFYLFHTGISIAYFNRFVSDNTGQGCNLYLTAIINENGNLRIKFKNKLTIDNNMATRIGASLHSDAQNWWIILHNKDTENISCYLFENESLSLVNEATNRNIEGFFDTYTRIVFSNNGNLVGFISACGYFEIF